MEEKYFNIALLQNSQLCKALGDKEDIEWLKKRNKKSPFSNRKSEKSFGIYFDTLYDKEKGKLNSDFKVEQKHIAKQGNAFLVTFASYSLN